jgi:alanyl-tRNA synthetase
MGLERVASILLGKMSNYDIDVFTRIFTAIQAVCPGLRPYTGLIGDEDKDYVDMAYRVVADHIRTLTFSITDGAVPSNEGRGYVLRRILRRAVRYGGEILKAPEGFFHQLVDIVVEVMSGGFPELAKNPSAVKAIIKEEEEIFSRTLKRGIAELDKRCKKLAAGATLPGDDAFKMCAQTTRPTPAPQRASAINTTPCARPWPWSQRQRRYACAEPLRMHRDAS